MRPLPLLVLLRLALLIAVASSAVLVVEYQNAGDPAFCGVGSGCFAVRISPYSRLFGVPLPYIGLIAHAGLLAFSFTARTKEHLLGLAVLTSFGAACAVVLLLLQQFAVGAFCLWCVAVDTSSIVAAVCAALLASQASRQGAPARASASSSEGKAAPAEENAPVVHQALGPSERFWKVITPTGVEALVWAAAAALAVALPFLWGRYPVVPPMPSGVAALAVPGKLTIVGFTDFQCPFCRKLHPEMRALEHAHEGRIHYTRRMMPLQSHPGAMPAAQAYVCSPEEKREAAADWLYQAPDGLLTSAGVLEMAPALGIDRAAFARCLGSPETQASIARDKELYESIGARGLPMTYVGPRMVLGYDPDRILRAVDVELHGEQMSLKLGWLLAVLGVAFASAALYTVRVKGGQRAEPASAAV